MLRVTIHPAAGSLAFACLLHAFDVSLVSDRLVGFARRVTSSCALFFNGAPIFRDGTSSIFFSAGPTSDGILALFEHHCRCCYEPFTTALLHRYPAERDAFIL